jgi:hypothetical protein
MEFMLPASMPLPAINPQRPSIMIGLPLLSFSNPMKVPELRLKILIVSSPKFPTSRSPAIDPKDDDAIARPRGESNAPLLPMRPIKFPFRSNSSTNHFRRPGHRHIWPILEHICDEEMSADVLDVERCITHWNWRILKRACQVGAAASPFKTSIALARKFAEYM